MAFVGWDIDWLVDGLGQLNILILGDDKLFKTEKAGNCQLLVGIPEPANDGTQTFYKDSLAFSSKEGIVRANLVFGIMQGRGIHGIEVDGRQVVLSQLGGDEFEVVFVDEEATDMAVRKVNIQDSPVVDTHGMKVCFHLADGSSAAIRDIHELVSVVVGDGSELTSGGEAGVVHLEIQWRELLASGCL